MENFTQKLKKKLEQDYGYDFDSEFFTDEIISMFEEFSEAANEIIEQEEMEVYKLGYLNSKSDQDKVARRFTKFDSDFILSFHPQKDNDF